MLFLGTEKYPDERTYKAYLNSHDGGCNAYTSTEHTNYYFHCRVQHDGVADEVVVCRSYFVAFCIF